MPFQKIQPERVAINITRQIESLILRGILRPGERLPSERDLAAQLEVSRPSLREALSELETSGLIETRPGSGAYIANVLGSAFAPPLIRLFSTHQEAVFDFLAFRRDLESLAAERAATEASDTDLEVISTIFNKIEIAHEKRSSKEEASLDANFHMAIIEASHNVVSLHVMRSMFDLLREGVFYNRQTMFSVRATRRDLLRQHKDIHDAIMERNPQKSREAMEAHIDFIEGSMEKQIRLSRNEETSRLRFEHQKQI